MDVYQIALKTGRGVTMPVIADLSPYLTSAVVRWGERGCETLDVTASVPRALADALLQRTTGGCCATFAVNGAVQWSGNVEEMAVTGNVVTVRAVGAWSALEREYYSELWVSKTARMWEIISLDNAPAFVYIGADRFEYDNSSTSLAVWTRTGETYGPTPEWKVGAFGIQVPHSASRLIRSFEAQLAFFAPSGWFASIRTYPGRDYPSASQTAIATYPGDGTFQTGTVSFDTLNAVGLSVMLYSNTDAVYTGQTRGIHLVMANPVVRTTTSTVITAQTVIRDIITRASPILVDGSVTATIGTANVDINELLFEDETLAQAIKRVEVLGDSTGRPWRVWFDETHAARFEPWPPVAGVADVVIHTNSAPVSWSARNAATRAYLTYQDGNGRTARTTPVANAEYFADVGFRSTVQAHVNTRNTTQLNVVANTLLTASAPTGRRVASIRSSVVHNMNGARMAGWQIRPGMRCLVNNAAGNGVQFLVGSVELDILARQTTLTAFDPLARIEQQVQAVLDNARPGLITRPRPIDGRDSALDWIPGVPGGRERPDPGEDWRRPSPRPRQP